MNEIANIKEEHVGVNSLSDPRYYLEHFVKIKGKEGKGLIPFVLKPAQVDIFNTLRRHNRTIIMKARQIGFSTCVTGYLYHKTIITEGVSTAIIGYNNDLTAELLDKVKTFYKTTPNALKPTILYNSKYEISFPKVDSKILVLPSTDNVGRGYTINYCLCVSGDTEVLIPDGGSKQISKMKKGDKVINGKGLETVVEKVWKKQNKENLKQIYFSNKLSFKATDNHEALTFSKQGVVWKKVGDLTKDDYLAYPITPITDETKSLDMIDVTRHDRGGNAKKVKMDIDLNYSFGLFCGWYLAEGCCGYSGKWQPNRIDISIDRKEVSHVVDIIKASILSHISGYSVRYSKVSRTAHIRICGRNFTNFIISKFGRISKEKVIRDEVFSWGKDFCEGLVFGMFCGDGSFKDLTQVVLTSTTQSIIYQTKKLLVSLNIGLASVTKNKSFRYEKRGRDRFDLRLVGVFNRNFRKNFDLPIKKVNCKDYSLIYKFDDKYYYHKIKKIETISFENYVYDLMVKSEDHSFCLLTNVLKNCTELPFWDNAEDKMVTLEASVPVTGEIILESSPGSIGDYFHRMWVSDNGYQKKEYGWWWDYKPEEIEIIKRRMNNPRKFNNNYALEFLISGRSVFSQETIDNQRKMVLKVGDKVKLTDGSEHTVYEDEGFVVFKPVEEGHFYATGCDVAEGVTGGDYSVCTILDRTTGEQVGFWRGHTAPDKFAKIIDKWGRHYNNALMVVEAEEHGSVVLNVLKNLLYPNLYFRPARFDTIGSPWSDKIGWKTTKVTRPILIDEFEQAAREGSVKIRSKEIVDEMTVFIFDKNNKMIAMQSYNDDAVFSIALSLQGFKVLSKEIPTQINYTEHLPISGGY